MFNVNDMFQADALSERKAAVSFGRCPDARSCLDTDDLAGWLKSFAIAAGWKATVRDTDGVKLG